jgi:hypothetical protein
MIRLVVVSLFEIKQAHYIMQKYQLDKTTENQLVIFLA